MLKYIFCIRSEIRNRFTSVSHFVRPDSTWEPALFLLHGEFITTQMKKRIMLLK